MAAMTDGPLVISISLGGRRDDLIGGCYAKPPLSMIGDVAYTKPKDENDYEMVVRELIHGCFTPMVRDFAGAGYPGPGDLLAPLQDDDYSIHQVGFEGREGTLKLLGRGLLFLPAKNGPPFFVPRGEIEFLEYRWHRLFNVGVHATLLVTAKNEPHKLEFYCIHRDDLPGLSNAIRGKGWNIADLEEYKREESPSVPAPSPAPAPRKKRRRLVKKYL